MTPRRKRKATNNGTEQHDGTDAEAPAAAIDGERQHLTAAAATIDGTGGQQLAAKNGGRRHLAAAAATIDGTGGQLAANNGGRRHLAEAAAIDGGGRQHLAAAAATIDGTGGQLAANNGGRRHLAEAAAIDGGGRQHLAAAAAAATIDGTGEQQLTANNDGRRHMAEAAAIDGGGRQHLAAEAAVIDGTRMPSGQQIEAAADENDDTIGQPGNKLLRRALANQRISSSGSRSTVSRTASPALSSTSSNAARRQRKNYNKSGRVPINVNADCPNVPPGVLPNPKTRQYQVKSVLAQFTHASGRKCYFLEWLGFRGRNSWCLSEDTDCTEYIERFGTVATVDAVLSALLGESVPASIADELQANPKFGQVLAKFNDIDDEFILRTTEYNILFAKGLMESREGRTIIEDAKSKLGRFVAKCMS
ncbi:hypothetical protein niasHT_011189 [Heterodera trifolii]|uniref:Chromo domain-containing protein n=1 Tax=Heterodera trifolii TaxID=157864 RepID=A0ABD2KVM0_9BILA